MQGVPIKFRKWLYRKLCNRFMDILTQEFLLEMLKNDSQKIEWEVGIDFYNDTKAVLIMTVQCKKAAAVDANPSFIHDSGGTK